MLGGGEETWMTPLDPEGNADLSEHGIYENSVGCHDGDFIGLNIVNPLPGYEYAWLLNPNRQGAGMGDALAIQRLQGHILTADDPEFAALQKLEGVDKQFLDSCTGFRELVPVRIPEEVIRQKREQEHLANLKMLKSGPAEAFVERMSDLERSTYGNKGPTRFRQTTHNIEFDEGGQTKELHMPDSGIVKTE
jgi:hypothetical protein